MGLEEHCLASILYHPHLLEDATGALQASEEKPLDAQDFGRPEDRAILLAWQEWLDTGGERDARAEFYDTLDQSLQERVDLLVRAQEAQPRVPDDLLREKFLDAVSQLRLRNLRREIDELRFLMDDSQGQAASTYGPLITQTTFRIRRLEQAMSNRSLSGRRHEDAPARLVYGEG
jgi:hypothetical protein